MSAKAQAIKMVVALLMGGVSAVSAREPRVLDLQGVEFQNPTGKSASFAAGGTIDPNGTFFQVLGTNGRSCATCHQPSDGWGLSAHTARVLFQETGGMHPLFEFDGQNGPGLNLSTLAARRKASSLMLDRALVRLQVNANTQGIEFEFEIARYDPETTYGNLVANHPPRLVVFRRPLPTSNLDTLSNNFWMGIGDSLPVDTVLRAGVPLQAALHLQAVTPLTHAQQSEIVAFMQSLSTAQTKDNLAKDLTAAKALGGPQFLSRLDPTGSPGFNIYQSWEKTPRGGNNAARQAIARGEQLFNAACSGCHSSPNRGNLAESGEFFDLGISDAENRTTGSPLYTLRCLVDTVGGRAGDTRQTTDPGRAMITGKWDDIGRFKVPNLRGLASRAPYFHNGMARTIEDVVDFYDPRLKLNLTRQEKADLVGFLRAL